jgi:hypothetical protein
MSNFFDKLNLRPQERMLLMVVGVATFVVLNAWLVWPHFNDWKKIQGDLRKARETLRTYQKEVARTGDYQGRLDELEVAGPNVILEEQDLDLVRTVNAQINESGIRVTRKDPRPKTSNTRTNQFFEEQTLGIVFDAGNEELVKFLVSLASTNSLIRVQDLDVRPDRSQFKLSGNLTLVASYQKNQPAAATSAPGNAAAVTASSK